MNNILHSKSWYAFEHGETIGRIGSENGTILLDEEYSLGARITLEQNGYHPWSITCGIYGVMMHTTFASNEDEARKKYEAMKSDIMGFLNHIVSNTIPEAQQLKIMSEWCDNFVEKY